MLRQWFSSLVNRAVTFMVVVILLVAATVTLVNSVVSRLELEAQARAQVESMADLMARELETKLSQRLRMLTDVAGGLAMHEVAASDRASFLLDRQVVLQQLFDGLFLIDRDGKLLAQHPHDDRATGLDLSGRAYFVATSEQLIPRVSDPFRSDYLNLPVVMMTAPVFDEHRRFIGVLAGALRLDDGDFLHGMATVSLGESGYVQVVTRSGQILAHPSAGLLLQPVANTSPAMRDAMDGFEGTIFSRNQDGLDLMVAVRQIELAPWFVTVSWPVQEAHAPVRRTLDMLSWIAAIIILLLGPLAFLVFRRLMSPMEDLAVQITERHLGIRTAPVRVGGGREIRQVADTFNQVLAEKSEVLASLTEREAFFRSLSSSAPIAIVQTDVLGRIEFVNPACEQLLGVAGHELINTYIADGVQPDERAQAIREWRAAQLEGRVFRGQFKVRHHPDNGLRWVDVMTAAIDTEDSTIGTITVARDITHELEVEALLRDEQQRADTILGVLQEGVLMVDARGTIRYANRAACRYLGAGERCENRNFFAAVEIDSEGHGWTQEDFLARGDIDSLYAELHNRGGEKFDVALTMLRLHPGEASERLVFVLRDDSERRRQEERLSWEATHDSLTGLLNRRAFNAALVKWLGEATNLTAPSVLMLIDLDYFKRVNDTGGHLLGDDLLRRLAQVFTDAVRQSDTVARLGGDEFGIILPACGLARAEELAESIRVSVEALKIESAGARYGVTTSIGLTELSEADSGPRETTARADAGCYAAKARGRNAVVSVPVPPDL